jgi:hypothetical protein
MLPREWMLHLVLQLLLRNCSVRLWDYLQKYIGFYKVIETLIKAVTTNKFISN